MAALNLVTELYVNGAWTSYAAYSAQGWSAQIGPDPESGTTPNKLEFALANDDLSMDPTNATSALYGKIGRNTPARIRIDGDIITVGESSVWKPDRSIEHVPGAGVGLSMIRMTAEGLLRRLGRWEDPLDSPLRRRNSSYSSLIGYWPLEDASGATSLAQVVTGGPENGRISGTINLAADNGAGGSDKTLTIGSGGQIDGSFRPTAISGWQVSFSAKLATAPSGAGFNVLFSTTDTLGRTWTWQASNTNLRMQINADDGTLIKQTDVAYGSLALTQWIRYRLKVSVSGGTVTFEPAWFIQDGSVLTGFTDTFASSSTGQPRSWRVAWNAYTDSASYGHVFAVSDPTIDLLSTVDVDAFDGFLGETAGDRFQRLMTEAGLIWWISGTSSRSALMGRQKPARLLDLLEECATTDGGLLFDDPVDDTGRCRLTFRLYNDMINRTPALALTYGTDIVPPLDKSIDDVGVANDVTINNLDGTTQHDELTTGRLSTQPPPSGVGRYKRTVDVNAAYPWAQLPDLARFALRAGTIDHPRYPAVVVDLLKLPGYRATINAMRPGDWITLTGVEPDPVTLMVIQIQRAGDAVRDTATLRCIPADPYMVGKYDDVARYDSGSTTLKTSVSSSATSLTFRTTEVGDLWSTTSTPYVVTIAGQTNTVTAMGAAALVSGAYDQVATVTRGTNGVTKALTAGDEIHIATPGRWAL